MTRVKATLDTNVLISGFALDDGPPKLIVKSWINNAFTLVLSSEILTEFSEVIRRSKIRTRYGLSETEISLMIKLLQTKSILTGAYVEPIIKIRDDKDNVILGTALAGHADFLVSGDKDLLVLKNHKTIGKLKIVTPNEFLAVLE